MKRLIENPFSSADRKLLLQWSKLSAEKKILRPMERRRLYQAGQYNDWYPGTVRGIEKAISGMAPYDDANCEHIPALISKLRFSVFLEAAQRDDRDAQKYVADHFAKGLHQEAAQEEAITWYRKSAELGNADAQYELATCYFLGHGLPEDDDEAIAWFRKAAGQDHPASLYKLGVCYESGIGVIADNESALDYFTKAAGRNYVPAQVALGDLYTSCDEIEDNETKARECYGSAAAMGDTEAMWKLGRCHQGGTGTPQDFKKALALFHEAAENGDTQGIYEIGYSYLHGLGYRKDAQEALRWFQKIEDDAGAQYMIGVCYDREDNNVENSEAKAVEWYAKAAEEGYPAAQYELGLCLYLGHGVGSDKLEAVEWFEKAAQNSHPGAQGWLGHCLMHGEGLTKDYDRGFFWLDRAADDGDAHARCQLGNFYKDGEGGLEQNVELALGYLKASAEQGFCTAQLDLAWLLYEGELIPEDCEQALYWFEKAAEQGDLTSLHMAGDLNYAGEEVPQNMERAVFWFQMAVDQGHEEAKYKLLLARQVLEATKKGEENPAKPLIFPAKKTTKITGPTTNSGQVIAFPGVRISDHYQDTMTQKRMEGMPKEIQELKKVLWEKFLKEPTFSSDQHEALEKALEQAFVEYVKNFDSTLV